MARKAATSPLEDVVSRWNQRAAVLQQQGITPDKYQHIALDDINSVRTGGTGISDQEAYIAATAAGTGHPVIKDQLPKTDPLSIIGNIPHDVEGIVKGFIPGVANLIHHLPSETKQTADYITHAGQGQWDVEHGYEDPSGNLGAAIRNVGKLPLTRLIPGVSTAAGLTTSEGRKQLERHPVGTALDILPIAGKIAELGVAGAGLSDAAIQLTPRAISEGAVHPAPGVDLEAGQTIARPDQYANRSLKALSEGRPVKAALHAIPKYDEATRAILGKLQLLPEQVAVTRGGAETQTLTANRYNKFITETVQPLLDHFKDEKGVVNEPALEEFSSKIQGVDPATGKPYDLSNLPPEQQVLAQAVRDATEKLANKGVERGELFPHTIKVGGQEQTEIFSMEGRGAKIKAAFETRNRRMDTLSEVKDLLAKRKQTYDELMAKPNPEKPQFYSKEQWDRDYPKYLDDTKKLAQQRAKAERLLNNSIRKHLRSENNLIAANKDYWNKLRTTAPARFQPIIEEQIKARMTAELAGKDAAGTLSMPLDQALKELEHGYSTVFDPGTISEFRREIESTWLDMVRAGYDPIWVHSVSESQFESNIGKTRPLSNIPTPGEVRDRTLSFAPRLSDFAVALSDAERQYLHSEGAATYIESHLVPKTFTREEVIRDLQPQIDRAMETRRAGSDLKNITDKLMRQHYVRLGDAIEGGFTNPRLSPYMSQDIYLTREVADASRAFTNPKPPSDFVRIAAKPTRVFKTAVMAFSPKFLSHVINGGTLSLIGRGGVEEFLNIREALHYALNPDQLPIELSRGTDTVTAEELLQYSHGLKSGNLLQRAYAQTGGRVAEFNFKLTETAANMQRAMAMLGEEDRLVKAGYTPEMARALGVAHANKVFVDMNGMSPLERNAIKQVIPFYGFTKQILRYVLSYPIDHPLRASILSNLGEMEQADWNSGLPRIMQQLFFFGKGNNKHAIDYRSVNPYRDVASLFTIAGVFRSLNPLGKGLLDAGGLNTLSGTPEMYPEVTYNTTTGKLEAKRPSGGVAKFIQGIIPEYGLLDHFILHSASMRRMQATNPAGFRKQLYASLNLPFVAPNVDIPYEEAKAEKQRFKFAQQQSSKALKTGHVDTQLNLLPYNGQLVEPTALQQFLDQQNKVVAKSKLPAGTSPKAITPRTTNRTKGGKRATAAKTRRTLSQYIQQAGGF